METIRKAVGLVLGLLIISPGSALSEDLEGAWRGAGSISLATGGTEQATCRARYTRRSNDAYGVSAVCATPSARAEQTASLHRIADNTYRGTFYNREYGVSGTILVRLNGKTHNVRLTSEAGSASLKFSR
jgi:hypothetical protein